MGAKKGSYETAVLKAVARCGALTAYEIAKEILKDRETREMINREGEGRSSEVLAIYPIVLKAVKRLAKNELLAVVKDGDKKKYGLTFKGLIYLEPKYQEIKGIIEKNREALFSSEPLQVKKEVRREKRIDYIAEYVDNELKFLLQFLTHTYETDYRAVIKFMKNIIKDEKNGEGILKCFHAVLQNYVWFETGLINAVKVLDNRTVEEVFKKYVKHLIEGCLNTLESAKIHMMNVLNICKDEDVVKLCKEKIEAIKRAQLILI